MSQQPTYQPPPPYYEDDEVTLKDIILTVKDYSKELLANLYLILAIIIGAIIITYIINKNNVEETTYTSDISFLVQEDQEEVIFPTNIEKGRAKKRPNKWQSIAFSSTVVNQILLEKIIIYGEEDFFGNHLIDLYKFNDKWDREKLEEEYQKLQLKKFKFTHRDIDRFEDREHRALQILREFTKKMFSVEGESITKIEVYAVDDKVSLKLRDLVFNALKQFYIEETVGRTQRNYNLLVLKVDSLERKFRVAQRKLANETDQTYGLISKSSFLIKGEIQEEVTRLGNLYKTFLNQKQQVEFTLKSKTPDFLIIDQTFLPIRNLSNFSFLFILLIGTTIGLFISIGFIIFRKVIRDALTE